MVLRINPSRMQLWRTPDEVQLGIGPGAVRIKGLSHGQERLLSLLYRGLPDDFLHEAAASLGADDPEKLLAQLGPVMLVRANQPTSLSAEYIEQHFAEICRAQAMHSVEGSYIIEQRKRAEVFVENCGETTTLIAASLGEAAIGRLVLEKEIAIDCESELVRLNDLSSKQIDRIDFAVLISNNAVSPGSYASWLARSIPHVSVVFDSEGLSVSPVIEASKTPCLSCFHESMSQKDAAWPAIASQLLFSKQRFDDVTARLFAAALVCQRIIQRVDGQAGFAIEDCNRTGYRLSISTGKITEFTWQFNEACSCVIR